MSLAASFRLRTGLGLKSLPSALFAIAFLLMA
jgi:hypothetical protein